MPMVRHDTIGQQAGLGTFHGLQQHLFERVVIRCIVKDGEPSVCSIHDVIDIAAQGSAVWPSHRCRLEPETLIVKNRFLTPFLAFGYTGLLWDDATKLQLNRRRFYDPATGLFTSQDPSGFFLAG